MSTTTETTAPETAPETDTSSPQGSPLLAALPGFRMRRQMPGAGNPDPAPPIGDEHQGDGAAAAAATPVSIPAFFKQRSKSYAKVAVALLRATGGWLNATTRAEGSEAFLPDEEDEDTIGPPLGRLAARRIKLGADPDQLSDIEDIGIAAVGVIVWLAKGFGDLWELRRARKRAEQDRAVYDDETGSQM